MCDVLGQLAAEQKNIIEKVGVILPRIQVLQRLAVLIKVPLLLALLMPSTTLRCMLQLLVSNRRLCQNNAQPLPVLCTAFVVAVFVLANPLYDSRGSL